jgi:hypothetical protein
VGGAHIADLVEAASGVNLWAEWARIEVASSERPYVLPPVRSDYAGLMVSLSRQEWPDTSSYNDPEVVWRMNRSHHVGLIVRSASYERVRELMGSYGRRIQEDFGASLPPLDKPDA